MLYPGSRYAVTPLMEPAPRETRALARRRIRQPPAALEYVVLEGERLDQLAARFYGDARKWWLICDANPSESNPLMLLRPGRRIVIPRDQGVRT